MPSQYITIPFITDPDDLADVAFAYLQARYPNWEPHDGQLDTWLISALARQAAEVRDVASDVPVSIFRYFGASLIGLPPQDAVPAGVPVTVTAVDSAGYTIPSGSLVAGLRDANGTLQGFSNVNDIVIPALSSSVAATLTAIEPGLDSSGLGGIGAALELISALAAVSTVVATATSSGGLDAETDDDYLDRLAADLALQAPRPILPNDFAALARNIAGVGRVLAIDGYDAVALTSGNARTVTVALTDPSGNAVGSLIKTAVQTYLQAYREVNFLVYVIDPTYTVIDVTWDVDAWPGFSSATVQASVAASLAALFNPLNWGNPPFGDKNTWILQSTVKIDNVIAAIKVPEVKNVNSVTMRTGVAGYAATDIVMSGPAPLPLAGASVGTVH